MDVDNPFQIIKIKGVMKNVSTNEFAGCIPKPSEKTKHNRNGIFNQRFSVQGNGNGL